MDNIPLQLQADGTLLRNRSVPTDLHPFYKKWLRFNLDFCRKYRFSETKRKSLDLFLQKLQEKEKTDLQQQQASHAIMLYYELDKEKPPTGMSWVEEYTRLSNEIQVRHYSPKSLKTYKLWVRHFQAFTKSQDSKSLSTEHVKAFLTFLAVTKKASASTQNQALMRCCFFVDMF